MSDLRDFNTNPVDNRMDVIQEPVFRDEPASGASLGDFHIADEEEPGHGTAKIVGALAVVLLAGAAVVYGYEVSTAPKPVAAVTQTASNVPSPPPAAQAPQSTPAQSADATSQPADATPAPSAPAPEASPAPERKPIRSARSQTHDDTRVINGAADNAAANSAPAQQSSPASTAAASPAPDQNQNAAIQPVQPVYPTAPPSAVANANNGAAQPEVSPPSDAVQSQPIQAPPASADATPPQAPPAQSAPAQPAPADQNQQPQQPAQ